VPRTQPPPRLYKYQPINVQTLANLKSAQLWFNAPIRFNDPFDCALPIFDSSRLTDADFLRAFNYYKEHHPTSQYIVDVMCPGGVPTQGFRDLILRSVEDGFAERRKIQLEQRGVACFSAKPLDITMWSHYADGHRGFCLEFDTSVKPFTDSYHVRYAEAFPYVNPVDIIIEPTNDDPENELLVASVLTKASCWQYEEEWRIMHMEPNKLFGYDWRALTGIYFGAAMAPAHKEILCLLLHGSPTQLYNIERDEKGFTLRAQRVTYKPYDYK